MSDQKIKKSNIYTKTGDKGSTSLYNGQRLPKNSLFFDVLGTLDEISSVIGSSLIEINFRISLDEFLSVKDRQISTSDYKEVQSDLQWIQSRLLDLGSHVATPISETTSDRKLEQTKFGVENVTIIEKMIDTYDSRLPKLKNFILPVGSLHTARSICRRAERGMVQLVNEGNISEDAYIFINRLSDFLFVIARFVSDRIFLHQEHIYKK